MTKLGDGVDIGAKGPEATERPLLVVDDITVRFGGVTALQNASFDVLEGEVCGLIGPNGAGKTTLFNCVSRHYEPSSGRIQFNGVDALQLPCRRIAGLGIARTFQNLGLFPELSVLENVLLGGRHRFSAGLLTAPLWLARRRREERAMREEALAVLERLRIAETAEQSVSSLPFGTLKRIELARALFAKPKLLLLDEPANGLTHSEVDALGDLLLQIREEDGLSVLLVEHHMGMVSRVTSRVVVLNLGRVIATGAPSEVARNPAVIKAYLGGELNAEG